MGTYVYIYAILLFIIYATILTKKLQIRNSNKTVYYECVYYYVHMFRSA